jgi:hypothetical protein
VPPERTALYTQKSAMDVGLRRDSVKEGLHNSSVSQCKGSPQASALRGTVGVEDQASEERIAEITSGKSRWQQGLVATCTDSSNEVKNRRRGEPIGNGE